MEHTSIRIALPANSFWLNFPSSRGQQWSCRANGAKVGLELWVRDTKFIVVLFNNYDIIFHVNNCKAAFAASCVSFPILSLLISFHPVLGNWHFLPVCVFSYYCPNKFFFRVVLNFIRYILLMYFFIKLHVHRYTWFLAILVAMDH